MEKLSASSTAVRGSSRTSSCFAALPMAHNARLCARPGMPPWITASKAQLLPACPQVPQAHKHFCVLKGTQSHKQKVVL